MFYFIDILKIALPIIMGNIGFIMIGVCDVIVAGRHSTDTLAAISIAQAITSCLMMLGIGILVSISSILPNYRGEGKDAKKYLFPSVKFGMVLASVICVLILSVIPFIDKVGFEPKLVPMIKDYFFVTAFATFGAYLHCVGKEYLQAFEIVIFPNILTIVAIFLNLGLNIIFVFGFGRIPSMGVIGLAIASLITRYFLGIVLFVYCLLIQKNKRLGMTYGSVDSIEYKKYYFDIIRIGLPASMAILIEFIGFNAVAVIMGRVSGIYAAAHNIMCTMTSVSFMVPLAISNATAIKVGYNNGAKNYVTLKQYAFSGIKMCVGFMACSALIISCCPEFLVRLFTNDFELIKVCIPIVYVLCFFQIFDGLQVSLSGIFRGIKRTKSVMVSNFISYWLIALPLGFILAFKMKLNLIGFWYSLGFSAVILCSMMYIILMCKFKKLV